MSLVNPSGFAKIGGVFSSGFASLGESNPNATFAPEVLNYTVQNTNTVSILIGSVPIAFGQSVEWAVSFGNQEIKGIGSAKPQEIVQGNFSAYVTIEQLVMVPTIINPNNAPSSQLSVYGSPTQNIINIVMSGSSSPLSLIYFTNCTCNDFNLAVRTNSPMTQRMTFQAMDVLDEFGISILASDPALQAMQTLSNVAHVGLSIASLNKNNHFAPGL